MNLEQVDDVIRRLESAVSGRGVQLPQNAEIAASFAFLGDYLRDRSEPYRTIEGRLGAEYLYLDACLAAGLRTLRERLRDEMRCDKQLSHRVLHVPNRIPGKERLSNVFFAICLFAYAGFSAAIDDFYIPGKRSNGIHLHGASVWVMFAATVCAVMVLLAVVVDHYDTRPNERSYERVGKLFRAAGWTLFIFALVLDIAMQTRR